MKNIKYADFIKVLQTLAKETNDDLKEINNNFEFKNINNLAFYVLYSKSIIDKVHRDLTDLEFLRNYSLGDNKLSDEDYFQIFINKIIQKQVEFDYQQNYEMFEFECWVRYTQDVLDSHDFDDIYQFELEDEYLSNWGYYSTDLDYVSDNDLYSNLKYADTSKSDNVMDWFWDAEAKLISGFQIHKKTKHFNDYIEFIDGIQESMDDD